MKNLTFFCSLFFIIFLFGSCSQMVFEKKENYKILTKTMINREEMTDQNIIGSQFFSSIDTIVLERKISEKELKRIKLDNEGTLIFFRGNPYERRIVFPKSPGEVVSITRDTITLEIKYIKVSFWENPNLFLIYGPADDIEGSFVLLPRDRKKYAGDVSFDKKDYNYILGTYSPLLIKVKEYDLKNVKKIAPGRRVKRKNFYFD